MFDLDPGKLIVIGVVALIAIPSKDLPRVLRTLGQATARMRRLASEFQGQFMEAMREAELADLQKEIEQTNKSIMASTKLDGAFDPLSEARKQIASAVEGEEAPTARRGGYAAGGDLASDETDGAAEASPTPRDQGRGNDGAGGSEKTPG
jgi:sec-independent protein translocase protein TatB